ncbi:MAG: EAL domain-containing protein [Pseudomonadota bacterium]
MFDATHTLNASILIVDDKPANVLLLERMLHGAGYTCVTSTLDPHAVYELHREHRYNLILLDLQMPGMDGFEVMTQLKTLDPDSYLPVLVITAQPEHKLRALQLGARDFISKPFDLPEVLTRIHNMLEVQLLHRETQRHSQVLEQTVQELRDAETGLRRSQVALLKESAALDDHAQQLQLANEHLVMATIKAHELAEEVGRAKIQMAYLAQHDALTGLPNRILLNDRLAQAMALAQRQGKQLALMFLDLDRFKYINDSLGHSVGDQLLLSVAHRLTAAVRSSDTVCRQGGDEFVILLADVEHAEDAALSAQKILTALTAPHRIDQLELHVTVSIGISIYPEDGQDVDTLIKSADTAMYHAKENGRNNFQFFEPNMNALAVERHAIESGLRRALEWQELVLHYQPKINLESGTITGVEALVRWQHPQRGLILPEQFVWIAEDCGLIIPIGTWVLGEACRQAQSWQDAGLPPIAVAVNISAIQFRHRDFLEHLTRILKDTGLAPHYLELELTESVLMHDATTTIAVLNGLKALGVRLAIDDFGTGYSSLSYLKHFQIDTLKIDQSFMRDITHASADTPDAAIITAVVCMGKSLNQRVIAEGVETREQLAFLQAHGCGEGQGYFFSRPVTAEALLTLLRTGIESDIV